MDERGHLREEAIFAPTFSHLCLGLRYLKHLGVNLGVISHNGHSALHKAALIGSVKCCAWLLSRSGGGLSWETHGAGNKFGCDPSFIAQSSGHEDTALWLSDAPVRAGSYLPASIARALDIPLECHATATLHIRISCSMVELCGKISQIFDDTAPLVLQHAAAQAGAHIAVGDTLVEVAQLCVEIERRISSLSFKGCLPHDVPVMLSTLLRCEDVLKRLPHPKRAGGLRVYFLPVG